MQPTENNSQAAHQPLLRIWHGTHGQTHFAAAKQQIDRFGWLRKILTETAHEAKVAGSLDA